MKSLRKSTSWEPVAPWYDKLLAGQDTYQTKVILPNLLRLLPPKGNPKNRDGLRIIDIACGQGFFSRAYAEEGASQVLGIDISPELIKRAQQFESPKLRFAVAPAQQISNATDASFDAALIILALQNIKEMPETLREAARVLKPHGTLIIVLNHPCFRIPHASAWGFDPTTKTQYRRIDRYGTPCMTKIDMTPGTSRAKDKVYTVSFHHPLQDYFKALTKAGFSVIGLEEWISHKQSKPGPRAAAEDAARKEFPLFVAVVGRRE
ncbi:MAG: hypothetical protein A2666_04500 [Parcubacteria group bacterium RIFCSPHIGHO2_01_FULL_47_10b]|nr:MAG: hypothetical protein A2666_04500 [Parcubacteria group bacterium RIFCSPHIGHO2_01_FULL_47_10b]